MECFQKDRHLKLGMTCYLLGIGSPWCTSYTCMIMISPFLQRETVYMHTHNENSLSEIMTSTKKSGSEVHRQVKQYSTAVQCSTCTRS